MVAKVVTLTALLIAILWLAMDPRFESAFATATAAAAVVAAFVVERRRQNRRQNQKVSRNSVGIQAGRDVTISESQDKHGK